MLSGLTAAYTVDEVVDNFQVLLEQADFHHELALLGVGRMRFRLRRKMKREWTALYIALWRLALDRSFPKDGGEIFEAFLVRQKAGLSPHKAEAFTARVREYVGGLMTHGDTDFTPTAEHLMGFVQDSRLSADALRLRLALHIRHLYTFIFDRLI